MATHHNRYVLFKAASDGGGSRGHSACPTVRCSRMERASEGRGAHSARNCKRDNDAICGILDERHVFVCSGREESSSSHPLINFDTITTAAGKTMISHCSATRLPTRV
jgi:hypothetical protein